MLREVPNLFRQSQIGNIPTDWFAIDRETVHPLLGLPGIQWKNNTWNIHLSTLPLLDDPLAQKILTPDAFSSSLQQLYRTIRDEFSARLGFKLRETQHSAINFAGKRRGTLIGDEMRLGKTLSAIMCHAGTQHDQKLVIVAPLMARAVWLGWLRRVFPDREIGMITGRTFDRDKLEYPIVFIHYDILHAWQTPVKIHTLIFDEAHALTNPKTRRTNAAVYLASHADRVIAMTGTPIWNMPKDLWSVLSLIAPAAFGGVWDFCMRYGAPEPTAYGMTFKGISNAAELTSRLSEVMIRRRWRDVQQDLPPITRSVCVVDVPEAMRRKLDVLAGEMKANRSGTIGYLARYRSQLSKIKAVKTVAKARTILERGEPVVIWTWHRELAETIAGDLEDHALMIHGEISPTKRDDIIETWKKSETPKALVATMAVGQVAIDLSHAPENIFAELDYIPAMIGQSEMRSFTPTRPLQIHFMVADHVIDQRIVRALVAKLGASDPLGLAAATDSIDALRESVLGIPDQPDLERYLDDILASID